MCCRENFSIVICVQIFHLIIVAKHKCMLEPLINCITGEVEAMGPAGQEVTARVTAQVTVEATLRLGVGGEWAMEKQCLQHQQLPPLGPMGLP